ncbi:MAG: hypothetical protein ACM3ZB_02555 [bacterium]
MYELLNGIGSIVDTRGCSGRLCLVVEQHEFGRVLDYISRRGLCKRFYFGHFVLFAGCARVWGFHLGPQTEFWGGNGAIAGEKSFRRR